MRERKVMKLASRGKRFGAACIDLVVPAVVCIIIIITSVVETIRQYSYMQNFGFGFDTPEFGYGYGYSRGISGGTVAAIIIALLLLLAYIVIQLVFFNKSTTIGKAALGLQVVSARNGEPIGFWKMLFREVLVKKASESVFLLGYIWVLIDDKNRGWHDKILDTYVVDLKESASLAGKPSVSQAASQSAVRPTPKSQPVPVRPVQESDALNEIDTSVAAEPQNQPQEAVIPLPVQTDKEEPENENEQKQSSS